MTRNDSASCPDLLDALGAAQSILICAHVLPDGDAVGSALALSMALRALGKDVTVACADPVPPQYHYLPEAGSFLLPGALEGRAFDAALAVDASRIDRLGACAAPYLSAPVQLQIDHHATNSLYGQARCVDANAAAAGCVAYRVIRALGVEITRDMAECLYCAISTDTCNFLAGNTTGEAFFIVAELTKAGLPLHEDARRLHLLKPEAQVRLLGRALSTLRVTMNGRCARVLLTREDYAAAGALPEHCYGIVDMLINMEKVEMAYIADSRDAGLVRVSMRARPPHDASAIARKMGGGGHVHAAGYEAEGELEDCCAQLDQEIEMRLEGAK